MKASFIIILKSVGLIVTYAIISVILEKLTGYNIRPMDFVVCFLLGVHFSKQ